MGASCDYDRIENDGTIISFFSLTQTPIDLSRLGFSCFIIFVSRR